MSKQEFENVLERKTLSIKEQFMVLKDLTIRLNVLEDIQLHQLKMWGLLIPGTTRNEVSVDFDKRIITMKLTSKDKRITAKKKKVCKYITQWTRNLLWDDTTVIIKIEDKILQDSRNV